MLDQKGFQPTRSGLCCTSFMQTAKSIPEQASAQSKHAGSERLPAHKIRAVLHIFYANSQKHPSNILGRAGREKLEITQRHPKLSLQVFQSSLTQTFRSVFCGRSRTSISAVKACWIRKASSPQDPGCVAHLLCKPPKASRI